MYFYPTVTSIGPYSFQNCTSLATFVIPSSVTTIDSTCFTGCTNLKITVLNPNIIAQIRTMLPSATILTSPTLISQLAIPTYLNKMQSTTVYGSFRNSDDSVRSVHCDAVFDRNLTVSNSTTGGSLSLSGDANVTGSLSCTTLNQNNQSLATILSGYQISGQGIVCNWPNSIALNGIANAYIKNTNTDGATSSLHDLEICSWYGIEFSTTYPTGVTTNIWFDCRTGTMNATSLNFTGSSTSSYTPVNTTDITNKTYVDTAISTAISTYSVQYISDPLNTNFILNKTVYTQYIVIPANCVKIDVLLFGSGGIAGSFDYHSNLLDQEQDQVEIF